MKYNKRLILIVFMLIITVVSGTMAWFTYSSKRSALVLTIGNIDSTQIILYPYQFKGTLAPTSTYESVDYIQVTAINNNATKTLFNLLYNIKSIENELINENVKYTITKSSTQDSGYTLYKEGNFSSVSANSDLLIMENESINSKTTNYYRVYLWLYNDGDQSSLQGKILSLYLNATLDGPEEPDLQYNVTNLSNNNSPSLGAGFYTLSSYTCSNGTTLSFDSYSRNITANAIDKCNLNFTSVANPLLYDVVEIGDYISYTGDSAKGCSTTNQSSNETCTNCNQCSGWNSSQTNTNLYENYGYCSSSSNKFNTYGWRVLHKTDNSVYIVSAGAPECVAGTSSDSTSTKTSLNTAALKYCNSSYLSGGKCDTTTAHAFNGDDFYKFTSQYYGTSNARYLYNYEDTTATSSTYCHNKASNTYCGYNNDIIDNDGYYWFASAYSSTYTLYWDRATKKVNLHGSTTTYGVRPVLKLDSSIRATGGAGTITNPYTISTKA